MEDGAITRRFLNSATSRHQAGLDVAWSVQIEIALYIVCFIACLLLFSLRNLDPIVFPTLYAEDGMWTGLILQNGVIHTAFHARGGFPVLGLVLMDWLGLVLDEVFSAGNILHLPYYLFGVSIAFLSSLSILPLVVFQRVLPLSLRLLLVAVMVFMLTGIDGNEIFGRIGNLAFLFPILCFYMIFLVRFVESRLGAALALAAVLVCALTFPVCLAFLVVWLVLELTYRLVKTSGVALVNYPLSASSWRFIGLLFCLVVVCAFLMPGDFLSEKGGAFMPYSARGMIDFAGARVVLFPLIASFYSLFNDTRTIIGLSIILVLALIWLFGTRPSSAELAFAAFGLQISFLIYAGSMVATRSGLSSFFGNYASSFPDRYFYGINVLFMSALIVSSYDLSRNGRWSFSPLFGRAVIVASAVLFACNVARLGTTVFELTTPAVNWRQYGDLRSMTCEIIAKRADPFVLQAFKRHNGLTDGSVSIVRDDTRGQRGERVPMPCPACDGEGDLYVTRATSVYSEAGHNFSIRQCKKCLHLFTSPEPSDEILARIYATTYAYEAHEVIADEKRLRAKALASFIVSTHAAATTALEIGCMHGHLLSALTNLGLRASGIEIDEASVRDCRRIGLDVTQSSFEECIASEKQRFDIVVLSHVLEHIRDASTALRQLQDLLQPGGRIILVVPNSNANTAKLFGRYWGYWQVPVHIHHFNESSLRIFAERAGLEVAAIRFHGADSLFFLSTISNVLGMRSSGKPLSAPQRAIIRMASRALRAWRRHGEEDLVCALQCKQPRD
jgi:2-polyprenyl-3-methyl-5-hydroxy-6-metoxy-1,4-benzoquinol methylase